MDEDTIESLFNIAARLKMLEVIVINDSNRNMFNDGVAKLEKELKSDVSLMNNIQNSRTFEA